MISLEDLPAIAVLASVPPDELARLAQSAGDVRLAAGDYAVHEGDERSLFVVLAGRIEVTKIIDGIERAIGQRLPGQVFGEIPITFGTPYQGSYRATVPTRLMHITARQFHALAAARPAVLTEIATLAAERIGGLRGIATAPPKARALMLAHADDAGAQALRAFLSRNQISHEWIRPDAPDRAARWSGPALADEELPALACDDGSLIRRACSRDVAEHLGLQTRARSHEYDTVIIGGGPAGLAAAVYGASEGLRTLVIEREAPGGQAETSSRIENYLGFPTGVSGDELARRALQQASRLGAEVMVTRTVTAIDPQTKTITLDGDETVRARSLIVATGVSWRRLATPGFERLLGKGVFYGASRSEAGRTQGQDIHLIGAGNSAGQAAMFFANHAKSVTLVVRGDALEKSMSHYLIEQLRGKPNIAVALHSEVQALHGDKQLAGIDLADRAGGSVQRLASGGVFVFIGADAETGWLPEAIARDARGYLHTGEAAARSGRWPLERDPYLLETSVPGIFACGDVRASPVKRVAAAVGEGSMAIAFVHQFLAQAGRS
ncbi:FAD-dependent oxidoreductase [Roseateles violae]|uniref:FAD-dependent oxidoreductase n=1 Tax=Roseateles violae TaxID=3058042 RepID=A0ABT8DT43_9BURK|nr:cyclic nucleotide-binding domain-containing thioredoxin-disulfide reductase [Pelomonas sp. PFR6]MDN3919532.1 FAD-dependent oxidoreductase [Pelomonas sp. PFR6]